MHRPPGASSDQATHPVSCYTLTPGVWTRGIVTAEYGVDLDAVTWVLTGDEHVQEYVAPGNVLSSPNDNLVRMLLAGEIDAAIAPGLVNSPDIRPRLPGPGLTTRANRPASTLDPGTGAA